jgi:hypothetical protein
MRRLLFTLLSLISLSALAQDCETQDFISEKNSPFNQIPTFNQAGSGLCYAASSTVLMNYELIKSASPERVHVLWTATRYAQKSNETNLDAGGFAETAMEETMAANCSGNLVSSEVKKYAARTHATEFEVVGIFDKFATFAEERRKQTGFLSEMAINEVFSKTQKDQAPFCGQVLWPELSSILKPLAQLTSIEIFAKLMLPGCTDNKAILSDMKVVHEVFEDEAQVSTKLKTILNEKKGPVAISLCKSALSDPQYKKQSWDDCDLHSVVVAGKKKIGNTCHFLVRDSKGTRFNKYSKPWKCLCKNKAGQFIDDCTRENNNLPGVTVEGCWVSEDVITRNTQDTQYLMAK